MDFTVHLYSHDYCPSEDISPFYLTGEESIWQMAYRQTEEKSRTFLRIFNEDGTKEWIAPMGGIVFKKMLDDDQLNSKHHHLYMPIWMLDAAGFEGSGEVLKCSILTNEAFPEATKITLRVVDSAFYNSDVKAELEAALTHLGILRRHTTIQIPVKSLGNFPVELFVSELEPADCVLCDGEEVALVFEEPVDHYEPPPSAPQRPPTPIPLPPAMLSDTMIPALQPAQTHGFVPFQGQGNLVGNSTTNVPEWRRQLGPPRSKQP
jgi:hypothetical protein